MRVRSVITGAVVVIILLSLVFFLFNSVHNIEIENAVYMEKDKLNDDMTYLESILENEHSIVQLDNGDYINEQVFSQSYKHHSEIVDHLSHNLGIEAAVYIKEEDSYHCITSSIVDSNGNPAIDIFLDKESAAYDSIQAGDDYTGKDIIQGNEYLTLYRPLFQPNTNEVIGILFTGIKMDAIKGIISHKSHERSTNIIVIWVCNILLAVIFISIFMRFYMNKRNAERDLQIIFDTMPLGANIHNKNFEFFECNDSVVKLFGFSDKQEYIKNFYQLSPEYQPDMTLSSAKMAENIDKAFTEGYCRFEWMHQKPDEEQIPCEIILVRTKRSNNFVVTAYVRDLRESKKMLNEINQREKLLNTVNSAAAALLSINSEASFKSSILKSLELIGNCLDVDRVIIWRSEIMNDEPYFVNKYQWLSEYGKKCVPTADLRLSYNLLSNWSNSIPNKKYISAQLSSLSDEREKYFFNKYEIKSIILAPLFLGNNFWGLFCICDCHSERTLSDDEISIITSLGLMMTNTIHSNLQLTKIRETNERVQIMFDAMPLGSSYIDANLNILDCNEGMLKIFNLSSKEEYVEKFYELSPELQPDGKLSEKKMYDFIYRAFVDGYYCGEWTFQNINGEPIPCEITLVRVKHYEDFVIASYVRDLREIKTAVTEMNKSKETLNLLQNMMNSLNAMIYVAVPHTGEILFINSLMKSHFKIDGSYEGKFCYNVFLNNQNKECDFCPCKELDKDPQKIIIWEMRNPITNRIYQNTSRYMEWSDGRTVFIQHSIDINELVIAKEQAIQANNAKSNFLAKMSHEIRTPMNAILGITEIQLQNKVIPSDIKEALVKINNSGYLLLGIINNILDMSKIESGKLELSLESYDVPSIINDTVNLNIILYDSKEIEFNVDVDENIPLNLIGDELRIKQIINNLLSNAFKYTEKGEVLMSISAEYQEDPSMVMLVLRVSDTGQGMTAEQLDKLFDEFTRFNADVNSKVEGTGLGMSITRQLVALMNGKIEVKSEPDKGSVFTVRLPQKIDSADVIGKELAEGLKNYRTSNLSQIEKKTQIVYEYMPYGRVLIVDDVDTNLYVARGLMSPYGLSLETAKSGFEMIEKIQNGAVYDIIFLDHFMPKMDGIEAVKIVRNMGYTNPIIALTANAIVGQADVFLNNGFDGFISKPIDTRQLNATLNKLIRDKYPPEVVKAAQRNSASFVRHAPKKSPASDPELRAIFTRDAENAYSRIESILSNKLRRSDDLRQYIIDVHSMKGSLANMGEEEASAFARKLETAGQSNDIPLILSETPLFLQKLKEVIEKIKPKENVPLEDSKDDLAFLSEKILAIKTACLDYDDVTANSTLKELKQKEWSLPIKQKIDDISLHLLHSDFEKAANAADEYIKSTL